MDIYYKKGANRPSYKWREAQVISKEGPLIRVNYLGWDSKFDENIDAIKDSKRLAKHQSKTLEVVSQTASTLEQNPVIPFVPPPPKDGTSTTTSSSNANATNNHVRKRTFDGELSRLLRLNFTGSGDNSVPGAEPSPSTKSNNSDEDEKSKTFKSRFNLRILRKWMSTRKNESLPNSPMSEGRSSNGSGDEEEIFEEVNDPNMKTPEELEAEIRKEKLFIETLKDKGLQVIEIEGDGNCLFRSISHQLFGVEDYHEDLRAQCVEHMIFHKNRFSMFCFEDFDEHMKEMAKVGIWGDDLEIRALEEIIDRNIRIYSSDSKEMGTPINNNFEEEDLLKGSPPITLSYHGSNHYNSVYDELHPLPLPARSSRTLLQSRIKLFENQPASPPRKPKSNASSNHSTPGQDYEQKTRMHAAAAHHLLQGQLQPQHPPGPMHISHSSGHFQPPMSSTMQMQQSHLNQYNGGIAAGINPPGHNVHYHLPVSPPHHIPNHHGAPHANIAAAHHHAVPNHQHPVGPGHHRVPSNSVPNYHDYNPEYISPNNMQKVPMLPLLNIDHGAYYSPTNAMKPITPRGVESARSNYPPISNEQAPNRHRRNYSEGNYLHVANEAMGYANMPPHGNMQHHNSNDNIYDNRMPMVDNNVYSGRRLS